MLQLPQQTQKARTELGRSSAFQQCVVWSLGFVSRADLLSQGLLNHLTIKKLHFAAAAQFRKAVDDLGANRSVFFARPLCSDHTHASHLRKATVTSLGAFKLPKSSSRELQMVRGRESQNPLFEISRCVVLAVFGLKS